MLGVIVSNWNLSVFVGQTSFQGFFFLCLGELETFAAEWSCVLVGLMWFFNWMRILRSF